MKSVFVKVKTSKTEMASESVNLATKMATYLINYIDGLALYYGHGEHLKGAR